MKVLNLSPLSAFQIPIKYINGTVFRLRRTPFHDTIFVMNSFKLMKNKKRKRLIPATVLQIDTLERNQKFYFLPFLISKRFVQRF